MLADKPTDITIPNVEPAMFELVLDYIYMGSAGLADWNVQQVMDAAETLGLQDLKRGCIRFVTRLMP